MRGDVVKVFYVSQPNTFNFTIFPQVMIESDGFDYGPLLFLYKVNVGNGRLTGN
jgi:hypothetical protein